MASILGLVEIPLDLEAIQELSADMITVLSRLSQGLNVRQVADLKLYSLKISTKEVVVGEKLVSVDVIDGRWQINIRFIKALLSDIYATLGLDKEFRSNRARRKAAIKMYLRYGELLEKARRLNKKRSSAIFADLYALEAQSEMSGAFEAPPL